MQPNPIPAGTGMATGERSVITSMLRGAKLTCPCCGKGAMFRRYLKVADECPSCGEELHHHRADDAPPYFTIIIVRYVCTPRSGCRSPYYSRLCFCLRSRACWSAYNGRF